MVFKKTFSSGRVSRRKLFNPRIGDIADHESQIADRCCQGKHFFSGRIYRTNDGALSRLFLQSADWKHLKFTDRGFHGNTSSSRIVVSMETFSSGRVSRRKFFNPRIEDIADLGSQITDPGSF